METIVTVCCVTAAAAGSPLDTLFNIFENPTNWLHVFRYCSHSVGSMRVYTYICVLSMLSLDYNG